MINSKPSDPSGEALIEPEFTPPVHRDKVAEPLMGKLVSYNICDTVSVADEIAGFFKDKDVRGYDKGLAVIDDTIRSHAKYRERDEGVVREWLKANGYFE